MNVLEAPPDAPVITISDLEAEIALYRSLYGISTDELLALLEAGSDRLEKIPDAGFWRSAHDALQRMRRYQESQPETTFEDPKGSSNLLWPSTSTSMRVRHSASFRR